MRHRTIFLLALALSGTAAQGEEGSIPSAFSPAGDATPLTAPTEDRETAISKELEAILAQPTASGRASAFQAALRTFYAGRDHRPFWYPAGNLGAPALRLLDRLETADREGLDPGRYLLDEIHRDLYAPDARGAARAELQLTTAFVRYALDQRNGQFSARLLDPDWNITQEPFTPKQALELLQRHEDMDALLESLPPQVEDYRLLVQALERYRGIPREAWHAVILDRTLHPGDDDPAVPEIRQRLRLLGDDRSDETAQEPEHYDAALVAAVKRYQQRHGLLADGVIGRATVQALNVPRQARIRQIEANLERWRWMPYHLGERYILVNAAGFELKLVEKGHILLRERVIAGKTERQTPSFSSRITRLVVNPTWTVPKRIAVEDLLPRQQRDPDFLSRKHITVYRRIGGRLVAVDPHQIDWKAYDEHHFPFVLRQSAGPRNSLGRLKFDLPNRYAIYLHDTPAKRLFQRPVRAFSSGCVRVEAPVRLADVLLRQAPGPALGRFRQALSRPDTQVIPLSRPMPIYIAYFTAWVDEEGWLNFRPDLYQRDHRVLEALQRTETGDSVIAARLQTP